MNHRRVRGRHRRPGVRGRRALTALVLLLGAGGLVAALLMTTTRDAGRPAPTPAAATSRADGADGADPARGACERTVAAGRAAVAAAGPSFRHWAGHVRAQRDYDAGAATLAQTRERWAATRATADADLADFARAHAAYEAVRGGCAAAGIQEVALRPAAATDVVLTRCRAEFSAVDAAVGAGKAVVDDWAAHVAMMKGEEHYGADEYGQMWRDMVAAAPADLDRFARASLAVSDAGDCPRPA